MHTRRGPGRGSLARMHRERHSAPYGQGASCGGLRDHMQVIGLQLAAAFSGMVCRGTKNASTQGDLEQGRHKLCTLSILYLHKRAGLQQAGAHARPWRLWQPAGLKTRCRTAPLPPRTWDRAGQSARCLQSRPQTWVLVMLVEELHIAGTGPDAPNLLFTIASQEKHCCRVFGHAWKAVFDKQVCLPMAAPRKPRVTPHPFPAYQAPPGN